MAGPTVRLDLRAVLPIAALAIVVLVIILVQLCGTEDVNPQAQRPDESPLPTNVPFTPGPSPTPGPTATPDPAGGSRDLERLIDLTAVEQALDEYREENGSYPSTDGNIQTLCAFTEFDRGCALLDVLDPLPSDPRGDPGSNGYWYTSDGTSFVVYAQREGDQIPACAEHPAHLATFAAVLCVQGP